MQNLRFLSGLGGRGGRDEVSCCLVLDIRAGVFAKSQKKVPSSALAAKSSANWKLAITVKVTSFDGQNVKGNVESDAVHFQLANSQAGEARVANVFTTKNAMLGAHEVLCFVSCACVCFVCFVFAGSASVLC